ncbi:MAG: ABC transporter permease [Chloroflexi bacterium]|nr:MAG: ABC transporter permease [Chloroflexota bacterium]
MRKAIDIAINDLRVFLREPGSLFGLLVLPIILTFIIGWANSGSGPRNQLLVDIVDLDGGPSAARFIETLRELGGDALLLCPVDNEANDCELGDNAELDEAAAIQRVEEGTTRAAIIIPDGFSAAIPVFENTSLTYISAESGVSPSPVLQAVNSAVLRLNGAIVAARVGLDVAQSTDALEVPDVNAFAQSIFQRADELWQQDLISVDYQLSVIGESSAPSAGNLQSGFSQSVPGIGSMFVMFTVFGGMTLMVVERKQGTLQRLAAMPLTKTQLIAGKILGRFVLGLLQFAVVFVFGLIFRVSFGDDPVAVMVLIFTYILAITALSFALGSRLENEQQASGLSLLLAFILAPLGGAWWPLSIVPEFMRIIGHISPIAWVMDGFNQLIFFGGGLVDILPYAAILLLIALVFFAIAIRNFRYTL